MSLPSSAVVAEVLLVHHMVNDFQPHLAKLLCCCSVVVNALLDFFFHITFFDVVSGWRALLRIPRHVQHIVLRSAFALDNLGQYQYLSAMSLTSSLSPMRSALRFHSAIDWHLLNSRYYSNDIVLLAISQSSSFLLAVDFFRHCCFRCFKQCFSQH